MNGHSPHSIFSSVLSQVSVPSSFAVAKRSNKASSSSSSYSSGGSSIGKALLGAVAVGVACSLASNPDACLSSAANTISGNNRSFNTGSSSKRSTLRSGTYTRSGNTIIGPTGEAYFTHGRVFQGTDGTLCHNTRKLLSASNEFVMLYWNAAVARQ